MSNDSYFDTSLASTNFYDEGPRLPKRVQSVSANTGSIDTTLIDGHRQGVEITRWQHFGKGVVKISAGEEGHQPKRNIYGQSNNFANVNTTFQDKDIWDSSKYLVAQTYVDSTSDVFAANIFTWPIIVGDNDQLENNNFNGVIEPLTIRALAGFFSIDMPWDAHEVRASLMSGNEDVKRSTDRVSQFFNADKRDAFPFFLDMGEENSLLLALPFVGYFNTEQKKIEPYTDKRLVMDHDISSYSDSEIAIVLSRAENVEAEDYIPKDHLSAAAGFDYSYSTTQGVDSIAFGGMTY